MSNAGNESKGRFQKTIVLWNICKLLLLFEKLLKTCIFQFFIFIFLNIFFGNFPDWTIVSGWSSPGEGEVAQSDGSPLVHNTGLPLTKTVEVLGNGGQRYKPSN